MKSTLPALMHILLSVAAALASGSIPGSQDGVLARIKPPAFPVCGFVTTVFGAKLGVGSLPGTALENVTVQKAAGPGAKEEKPRADELKED